jgi:hypothetical protein
MLAYKLKRVVADARLGYVVVETISERANSTTAATGVGLLRHKIAAWRVRLLPEADG